MVAMVPASDLSKAVVIMIDLGFFQQLCIQQHSVCFIHKIDCSRNMSLVNDLTCMIVVNRVPAAADRYHISGACRYHATPLTTRAASNIEINDALIISIMFESFSGSM